MSWSSFWSNSSSKTPQGCTSWTLHSSMVQKRNSLITECKVAHERTFSPLTDSWSQECTKYSIKGTLYTGLKRQAALNPCVMCLFCKCNYRCCKTSEIICLKITWHNQDSTRWGFWFVSTWEKGRNIKMIAHALKNLLRLFKRQINSTGWKAILMTSIYCKWIHTKIQDLGEASAINLSYRFFPCHFAPLC